MIYYSKVIKLLPLLQLNINIFYAALINKRSPSKFSLKRASFIQNLYDYYNIFFTSSIRVGNLELA